MIPVTVCPICGMTLRLNYGGNCLDSDDLICNIITDCNHFRWISIGNACYDPEENPEICKGVEKLKNEAIDVVYDGTTVWLLVPAK